MSLRLFSISLLILTLSTVAFSAAQTTTYVPGVKVDDWGTFTVAGNATIINDVTLLKTTVVGVSGTNVTTERTAHFKNGTQASHKGWNDVRTGATNPAPYNFTFLLIAKGLGIQDLLYEGQPYIITETGTLRVAGVLRSVNIVRDGKGNHFVWDRLTGFIVSANATTSNSTFSVTMEQTNMWTPPTPSPTPFPTPTTADISLPPVTMIAITLAAYTLRVNRQCKVARES